MQLPFLVRTEKLLIVVITAFYYFLSYFPITQNIKNTPPDRVYMGSTDYPLDMMGNLASVQEGYLGHWKRFSQSTTTIEAPGSFIKFEYIFIGQIARVFHLDPFIVFHFVRGIISLLFVGFIYKLIRSFFATPQERIAAFAFSLFATGILPAIANDSLRILIELPSDAHVFQRLTTTAHHYLLGSFFSMISLYFLSKWIDHRKKNLFLFACVFGFSASFVYIPTILLVLLSLPLFLLIYFYCEKEKRNIRNILHLSIPVSIYAGVLIIPVLYLLYVSQFWEFNTFAKTEKIIPSDISFLNYPMIVGLPFILSIFSIPTVLKRKKTLFLLFIPWVIIHPLATLILSNFLSINKLRFFFGPYFLIFALLGTVTIINLAKIIHKRALKISTSIILFCLVFIFLYPSKHAYVMSYRANHVCFCTIPLFDYGYPKKGTMEAIYWLRDNSNKNDTVFSGYFAGILIPAFSGNRVYTSWWFRLMQPSNFDSVISNYQSFLSQRMTQKEARDFMIKEKIRYVFVGEEEQPLAGENGLKYPFLREVIRSDNTVVYKVVLDE